MRGAAWAAFVASVKAGGHGPSAEDGLSPDALARMHHVASIVGLEASHFSHYIAAGGRGRDWKYVMSPADRAIIEKHESEAAAYLAAGGA